MSRNSLKNLARVAAVPLLLATITCSSNNKKNPTEPVEPGPPAETVTQTFRGSLPQRRFSCHDFSLAAAGDITTTITDLAPLRTLTVGLGLGVPSGDDANPCSLFGEDDSVRAGDVFLSSGNQPGAYCSCIFDVGNIFPGETIDYVMEVTHP